MADGAKTRFEDADAAQPPSLGRRGNMLLTPQAVAKPDTPTHTSDGFEGASIPRQAESRSSVSSVDTQANSRPPGQALWMQGLPESASRPSSGSSSALKPMQQRPWELQLPASSRSADSLSGSSTIESRTFNDMGRAAHDAGISSPATSKVIMGSISGRLQLAAPCKDKEAEIKITSIHSTGSVARPDKSQTAQRQETLHSPAKPAASLYAIFSPGQPRHGLQALDHIGSQGAASSEAATADHAPGGAATSDTENPARVEAELGLQSRGVACSRSAAAGSAPEWLHNDLDEMLPDGLTIPARYARPQQVSKAQMRSAAAAVSTTAVARNAAGPAVASMKAMDTLEPLERYAVVEHLGSVAASTERTAIPTMAGAQPPHPLKATLGSAAAIDCPSSPVGTGHAEGAALAAALATASSVNSAGADCDESDTPASKEALPVRSTQIFTPLTSILAAKNSATSATAVAQKNGGHMLTAETSNNQSDLGSDVPQQHSSIDRVDRCSVLLERQLKVANARCAELEAESAAKEAAAQLTCLENVKLAARCERLDGQLAEAEDVAQLIHSEQSSLEERCRSLEKEATGHAASMHALIHELDESRSRYDTLEEMLADREVRMEKAVADLTQSRAHCEELQQRVRNVREEVKGISSESEELTGTDASQHTEVQRQRLEEQSRDIEERLRQLRECAAALAAKEQLWAAERPRILGAIRRMRSERRRLRVTASKSGAS